MAISLGDAAIAFAGGAAKQYNKMADEERKAKADRQKRVQELLDQVTVKQAETEYTQDFNDFHKRASLHEELKSTGGPDTVAGQMAIAKYYDMDWAQTVRGGAAGTLTAPELGKSPLPYTDRMVKLFGGDFGPVKTRQGQRMQKTTMDKKFDKEGRAIPRDVSVDENGKADVSDFYNNIGLGLDAPAYNVSPLSSMSEEARQQALLATLGESDKEIKWDDELRQFVVYDPRKGTAKAITPEGIEEAQGELPDKDTLDALQQRETFYREEISAGKNVEENTRRLTETQGLIQNKIDQGVAPEILSLREQNKREIQDLRGREAAINTAMAGLNRYENLSTESAGGISGWLTGFADMIGTNIRGMTDTLGATQALTIADRRAALETALEGTNRPVSDLLESNAAIFKGMEEAERTNLLYSVASVFRESGRRELSNADIERAEKIIQGLSVGGDKQLGAMRSIRHQVNRRLREVNLALYESKGISPEQKLMAGINWLQTERVDETTGRTIPPIMPYSKENPNGYIIINGQIGLRGPNDSIISLDDYLMMNPVARRM